MKIHEKVSYCGIYCGGCRNFKENMNCQGCRYEEALVTDCPLRSCAMERKLTHCGECLDFPCDSLNAFYYDGKPSHALALQNMLHLRAIGVDAWDAEMNKAHTCTCGSKIFWMASKCENPDHNEQE